jgi:FkbM family methyltransferase
MSWLSRRAVSARDALARATGIGIYRYPLGYSMEAELRRVIASADITVVVDVGGHRGQFGARMREAGYRGQLISFEPGPDIEALSERAAADGKWSVVGTACGSRHAHVALNIMGSTDFNSLHAPRASASRQFRRFEVVDQRPVEVVRLDEALADRVARTDVIMLKSDTQGHDLEVLRGAEGLWGQVCAVVVEASVVPLYEDSPLIEEMIGFLRDRGFVLAGVFPVSRPDLVVEFDCLFVRDRR